MLGTAVRKLKHMASSDMHGVISTEMMDARRMETCAVCYSPLHSILNAL